MKPKKIFELAYGLEPLTNRPGFLCKRMFGGLAVYLGSTMVLVLMENEDDPDWNGVLIPTFREKHENLIQKWPMLIPHSILPKWLYLPLSNRKFTATYAAIVKAIVEGSDDIGIQKKTKTSPKLTNCKKKKQRSLK